MNHSGHYDGLGLAAIFVKFSSDPGTSSFHNKQHSVRSDFIRYQIALSHILRSITILSQSSQERSNSTIQTHTAAVVPVALRDNSTVVSFQTALSTVNSSHHLTTCLTKKISLTTRMRNSKPLMQQSPRQQPPMEPQRRKAT